MTERRFILTLAALLAFTVALLIFCGWAVSQTTAPATQAATTQPTKTTGLYSLHLPREISEPYRPLMPSVAWAGPRALQLAMGWDHFPKDELEKIQSHYIFARNAKADNAPMVCIDAEWLDRRSEQDICIAIVRHVWPEARIAIAPSLPFNRDYLIRYSMTLDNAVKPPYTTMPPDWCAKMQESFIAARSQVRHVDVVLAGAYLLGPKDLQRDLDYIVHYRKLIRRYWGSVPIAWVAWGDWHDSFVKPRTPLPDDVAVKYARLISRYDEVVVFGPARAPEHDAFVNTLAERLN